MYVLFSFVNCTWLSEMIQFYCCYAPDINLFNFWCFHRFPVCIWIYSRESCRLPKLDISDFSNFAKEFSRVKRGNSKIYPLFRIKTSLIWVVLCDKQHRLIQIGRRGVRSRVPVITWNVLYLFMSVFLRRIGP